MQIAAPTHQNLELPKKQLRWAGLENAMILAAPGDKVRSWQQIEDLRLEMRPFEEEPLR